MTALLLDHPWPLDAAIDAASKGFDVLRRFENLVRRTGLPPVPFADWEEYNEAVIRLKPSRFKADWFRFVQHCIRPVPLPNGTSTATPNTGKPPPEPPLSVAWRRTLRAALGNGDDWRNPQIVLPDSRRSAWLEPEVDIALDDQPGTSHRRLTVPLDADSYEQHRYATADVDPWRNLEWITPPVKTGGHFFYCRLPRPPSLSGVQLTELAAALPAAQATGWKVNGRYYFVPPEGWDPNDRTKTQWRNGRAFEPNNLETPVGVLNGPEDSEGRIWAWDKTHGHWDVQHDGTYTRVNHEGRELPKA